MVLVRRLLGGVLRRQRMRQGRTLRQVSAAAQVSLGYLSEIERGQKEASSELLAAVCAALDVPLSTILRELSDDVALAEAISLTPTDGPAVHDVGAERLTVGQPPESASAPTRPVEDLADVAA